MNKLKSKKKLNLDIGNSEENSNDMKPNKPVKPTGKDLFEYHASQSIEL
jgi:hypothetical protein